MLQDDKIESGLALLQKLVISLKCVTTVLYPLRQVLGTVRYQAPEVLRGGVGGSHSDVFSLGVTIWHLLTRSLPYQGLHPHIVIYQARAA